MAKTTFKGERKITKQISLDKITTWDKQQNHHTINFRTKKGKLIIIGIWENDKEVQISIPNHYLKNEKHIMVKNGVQ